MTRVWVRVRVFICLDYVSTEAVSAFPDRVCSLDDSLYCVHSNILILKVPGIIVILLLISLIQFYAGGSKYETPASLS